MYNYTFNVSNNKMLNNNGIIGNNYIEKFDNNIMVKPYYNNNNIINSLCINI